MFTTSQKKILLWVLIWFIWIFSFSYAQDNTQTCITCGTMASELQDYISFANQMIDVLDTQSNIIAKWSSYNVFGPWQGGTYNGILVDKNPSWLIQSIVLWTLKNLDKRQSYIRSTIEVLSIYTFDIMKDGSLWFLVASQPRPIMRDFQYLLDIDTLISDKIYDLWTIGAQWKQLTTAERNAMITLLKNNTGEGKIFDKDPIIDPAISSTDVLRLLLRINNRNKKTLTLSTTSIDNTVTANKSTLYLSQSYYRNMVEKYECARIGGKNMCWGSRANFKKSIDTITKSFIESGPKQSREKINKAYNRLITRGKLIIGADKISDKNIQDYRTREHELITSRWDGATLVKRTWWWILTWALSSNIPRIVQQERKDILNNSKEISNVRKYIKDTFKPQPVLNNLTKKQQDSLEYPTTISQVAVTNKLTQVINQHSETKISQLKISPDDSIEAIYRITERIRLINNILANNIKSDLTRTCNLQCSNLWWICW